MQETGLALLHASEDENIWRQITDGFAYDEESWWDCFSHQMYRVTLGMLRAWSENPFSDHSHIKTLTLRSDITERCENISFVQHFSNIETLNVYKLSNLKTLDGLEEASTLVELDARQTGLTDLRGLGSNPSLKTIIVRDSQVATLNGIKKTHRELSIDARGTPLLDVSAIPQEADVYLCVDDLPAVGSRQVTYLRFATEWLTDVQQFPNVHTVYVENALYCAKGLLDLKHLKQVFVKGHRWSDLFNGGLRADIRSLNLHLSSDSWAKSSILFGDTFWKVSDEDWKMLCAAVRQIEERASRTFHAADERLWSHCAEKITAVHLLSSDGAGGAVDHTALATLPKVTTVHLELSLQRQTLQMSLPPLRDVSQLLWSGCSSGRRRAKSRQYLESVVLSSPVFVESLVIQDFPALNNTFLKTFQRSNFPNLKQIVIRRCPKLSKRMAGKIFKDIELTFE